MSVTLKSQAEIAAMREAGRIVADALVLLRESIEPGMTTRELDRKAERYIRSQGAEPAFPHINRFPGTVCISVNEQVVHGIPGSRRVQEGDLVKLDIGAILRGYHGDAAITVPVGRITDEAARLIEVTEHALAAGMRAARPGGFLYDIGAAIEEDVTASGFSLVEEYTGHGIGRHLHEEPSVPHVRQPSRGLRLKTGMTLTIEPMVNAGSPATVTLPDRWTVVTRDRRLSAQFEHTVAITEGRAEILTLPSAGAAWGVLPLEAVSSVQ